MGHEYPNGTLKKRFIKAKLPPLPKLEKITQT